ncbi:MAG: hypothetical protein C5B53_03930, partial [Candidatus Melainabacteria bacterium]
MLTKKNKTVPDLLQSLEVAAPCPASWESMKGDERVRHCLQCNKNVYNISKMTDAEANEFLSRVGQNACVMFYRRADGNIILDNCPIGLRRLRAQYRRVAAAVGTIIAFTFGFLSKVYAQESGAGTHRTDRALSDRKIGKVKAPDPLWLRTYKERIESTLIEVVPKEIDPGK